MTLAQNFIVIENFERSKLEPGWRAASLRRDSHARHILAVQKG